MHQANILSLAGLRIDGRKPDEVRHIAYKINVTPNCEGSCYYEQGMNKVLVYVHGPMEPVQRHDLASDERGYLSCRFSNAPFSGNERKRKHKLNDRRAQDIESIIEQTFSEIVKLELYQSSEIAVVVHLLEGDGSSAAAVINATSIALMRAGIAMKDIVSACTVGIVKGDIYHDLNQLEISTGCPQLFLAVSKRTEEVVYLQIDNKLSMESLEMSMISGILACKKIANIIENGIKDSMIESYESMATRMQ